MQASRSSQCGRGNANTALTNTSHGHHEGDGSIRPKAAGLGGASVSVVSPLRCGRLLGLGLFDRGLEVEPPPGRR